MAGKVYPHRKAPPISAEGWVGTYRLKSGFGFTVAQAGGKLTIQPDGQAPLDLRAFGGRSFRMGMLKAGVTFEVENGRAHALVFLQNGQELTAGRVSN